MTDTDTTDDRDTMNSTDGINKTDPTHDKDGRPINDQQVIDCLRDLHELQPVAEAFCDYNETGRLQIKSTFTHVQSSVFLTLQAHDFVVDLAKTRTLGGKYGYVEAIPVDYYCEVNSRESKTIDVTVPDTTFTYENW